MKGIILAAGKGTRLNKYTKDMPKGLLQFEGTSLLQRQVNTLKSCGIVDITIVTGYMADQMKIDGVKYYNNPQFSTTNMLESLFCAEVEFTDELMICYGDIIYEERILNCIINKQHDITVAVDSAWHAYWQARYDKVAFDLESLSLDNEGRIVSLGKEVDSMEEIDARYVGLIKFSKKGVDLLSKTYHQNRARFWDKPWQQSGKTFQNAFMTDMLQELIDQGHGVYTSLQKNGWLEFDTNEDYERMISLSQSGELTKFYNSQLA